MDILLLSQNFLVQDEKIKKIVCTKPHPPTSRSKVKWSTPYTPREKCTIDKRNLKNAENFVALDLTTSL